MSTYFFTIAIGCAIWGIVSSISITSYLSKRGVKINYIFIRILIIKYVHQYKDDEGRKRQNWSMVLLIHYFNESCPDLYCRWIDS